MKERTTPQFTEDGEVVKNSIAVVEKIKINDLEQGLLIRGKNTANPILLILHGGPGAPHIGYTRHYQQKLEENFIVVNWDQRGSGMSYYKGMPEENMNLEQFISDAEQVIKYLLNRFSKNKIILMGYSWGSLLGMNLVNRYPQYIELYFGMTQMANTLKSTDVIYQKILKMSENNGELKQAVQNLDSSKIAEFVNSLQKIAFNLGGMHTDLNLSKKLVNLCSISGEYNEEDLNILDECMAFSGKCLYPSVLGANLIKQVNQVEVPICFFIGKNDLMIAPEITKKYFDILEAPKKELVVFENSSHDIMFAENEKWQDMVIEMYEKMC